MELQSHQQHFNGAMLELKRQHQSEIQNYQKRLGTVTAAMQSERQNHGESMAALKDEHDQEILSLHERYAKPWPEDEEPAHRSVDQRADGAEDAVHPVASSESVNVASEITRGPSVMTAEGGSESEELELPAISDIDPPSSNTRQWWLDQREMVLVGVSCSGTALVMIMLFCIVNCVRAKKRKQTERHGVIRRDWNPVRPQNVQSVLPRSAMRKKRIVSCNAKEQVHPNPVVLQMYGEEGLSEVVQNANAANDVLMDDIIDEINDEGNEPVTSQGPEQEILPENDVGDI